MIFSNAYDYINVLDKAADASWTRNNLLSNNIANVDTPNYSRKDISFTSVLQQQLSGSSGTNLDQMVSNVDLDELNGYIYTDMSELDYRLDGNNVDIDTENVELASNQILYDELVQSMSQEERAGHSSRMMAVMMLNKAVRRFPFILQSPHQKSAQSFSWLPQHRSIG